MPPPRPLSPFVSQTATTCRVGFGGPVAAVRAIKDVAALSVALPVLRGLDFEEIAAGTNPPVSAHGCTLFSGDGIVAGFAVAPAGAELEHGAEELYQRIFDASRGQHLYRVWNYVPQINAIERGLENYRRFCLGRSNAFEKNFGAAFRRKLPAASAVGAIHGPLAVAFLAGEVEPRHFENPRQVPAFEYPALYGPRPPSFSRATLIESGGRRELFISGTAAIRGHATIGLNDLSGQLACTRENLEAIGVTAGAGASFGAAVGWQRSFKVYLRHANDLLTVEADLRRHLLRKDDSVTYLHADLCRSDLLVEVEAVLTQE